MKKIISNIKTLAALFMAGAAMTACTSDELVEPVNTTKTYTLTVNATKGSSSGNTRALELDGKTLNATWATGETVYVMDYDEEVGTLNPETNGISTFLKGTLSGEFSVGYMLDLIYPRATVDYRGQVGTLADIAAKYDYATATATISSISDSKLVANNGAGGPVVFENQQAIVKFTLLQSDGTPLPSNPTAVSIYYYGIEYGIENVSLTSIPADTYTTNGNGVLYVAIPGFSGQKVTVTATVGEDTYAFEQPNVTFSNGQYYAITVKMSKVIDDSPSTPLTFEALEAGCMIYFPSWLSIEYSTDGIVWNTWEEEEITLSNVGDKVSFRGDNTWLEESNFFCDGPCYIYGNVMSLINSTDFETATELTEDCAFKGLFRDNDVIYTHPTKKIVLPATTLTQECYKEMFYGCASLTTAPELPATELTQECYSNMFLGCTNLTTAPELPATTLANNCYFNMFYGCASLTTAPELPATTLAQECYRDMFSGCTSLTTVPKLSATTLADYCCLSMFSGCTSLTTAPELPATTLAQACYSEMFSRCTSLTTAPELPATTLAQGCYKNMFSGCASLTTAPELPATTLAQACYSEMFSRCTSLTTAPELPATTLDRACYYYMFNYCTSLNSVKCLATDISAQSCTFYWLNGVSSTGTFTKAAGVEWPTGVSGIPSGWTVLEE